MRVTPLLAGVCLACSPPTPVCPKPQAPPPAARTQPPQEGPSLTAEETFVRTADVTLAVRARPFANLAYQLDCLSGHIHCEETAFHALWDPGWTVDDSAALAEWKAVHEIYDVSVPLEVGTRSTPLPLPATELDFDKRLRIAAFVSNTLEDYRHNLRVLLPSTDTERLCRAAEHFRPRFEAFWSSTGAAVGSRFRAGLEALFAAGELPAILGRAIRFYGSPIGRDAVIDFDLVVLPVTSKHSNGEQLVSHGVIEVASDEKPDGRMDVVCHELFHFFYSSRSPEQQAALMGRFFATHDPLAQVAYALMDESVATALGNGVVDHAVNPPDYARRLAREQGFYAVHSIDATAKGLLARTAADPTLGPALDSPETVAALIASTRDAVGTDPAPLEYLRQVAGVSDAGWWAPAMKTVTDVAHSNDVYNRVPVDGADAVALVAEHPSLPAVLLVPRNRLGALAAYGDTIPKAARAAIAGEARKPGPFAYVLRRPAAAWLFVIVAESPAQAKQAATALFLGTSVKPGVLRAPL